MMDAFTTPLRRDIPVLERAIDDLEALYKAAPMAHEDLLPVIATLHGKLARMRLNLWTAEHIDEIASSIDAGADGWMPVVEETDMTRNNTLSLSQIIEMHIPDAMFVSVRALDMLVEAAAYAPYRNPDVDTSKSPMLAGRIYGVNVYFVPSMNGTRVELRNPHRTFTYDLAELTL